MAPSLLLETLRLPSSALTLTPPESPKDDPHVSYSAVASSKQADRDAILNRLPHWRLPTVPPSVTDVTQICLSKLSPHELDIVHLDATALVALLRKRVFSATQVLAAFCKVATAAQDTTNCLTEIFFDDAFARARELDQHIETTGAPVGPLHGLPVSIKDHILVKGQDTSAGYASWAYKTVADKDALVVRLLREAGAILYVKTANPQTLLSLETENNIYGTTTNPWNRNLTPGGSSGGESALIACRGSPLGVGTDIGGSIRVPAAHCGIYGLKGSVARFPHGGLLGSHDGMEAIVGALGPMASSARDLALWCQVMLQAEPWYLEPPLLNMPWKQDVAMGIGLAPTSSFAIIWDDGVVAPHPPILDALLKTKEALLAAGHEVIDWVPIDHDRAWDVIVKLYLLDGGEEYRATMAESGEPPVPMTEWMLSHSAGRKPYTPAECFKLNAEREALRAKIMAHWNETSRLTRSGRPVDAILCPVFPSLAPLHGTTRWWGYTAYWNVMDYPGVVFPVGRMQAQDYDGQTVRSYARNPTERFVHAQWSPAKFDGAPISLQLVGRRHEEEKLLAMLSRVEDARKQFIQR